LKQPTVSNVSTVSTVSILNRITIISDPLVHVLIIAFINNFVRVKPFVVTFNIRNVKVLTRFHGVVGNSVRFNHVLADPTAVGMILALFGHPESVFEVILSVSYKIFFTDLHCFLHNFLILLQDFLYFFGIISCGDFFLELF
jgi:hypothetical protein